MKRLLVWLLAIAALVAIVVSFRLDMVRGQSFARDLIIAVGIYAVVFAAVRLKLVTLPPGVHLPLISSKLKVPDLLKGAISIVVACLWVYVTANLASDTWWVAGFVFGPSVAMVLLAGFFIFRSLGPKN